MFKKPLFILLVLVCSITQVKQSNAQSDSQTLIEIYEMNLSSPYPSDRISLLDYRTHMSSLPRFSIVDDSVKKQTRVSIDNVEIYELSWSESGADNSSPLTIDYMRPSDSESIVFIRGTEQRMLVVKGPKLSVYDIKTTFNKQHVIGSVLYDNEHIIVALTDAVSKSLNAEVYYSLFNIHNGKIIKTEKQFVGDYNAHRH